MSKHQDLLFKAKLRKKNIPLDMTKWKLPHRRVFTISAMTTPFLSNHRNLYLCPEGHVLWAALEEITAEEHRLYIMKYLNDTEADFVFIDGFPLRKLKLRVSQKMTVDSINYSVQLFCFQCLKTWHLS